MNRMRRSMLRVSNSVFLTYRLATWEKSPISMLPTVIRLFFSTRTGCSSSASHRI